LSSSAELLRALLTAVLPHRAAPRLGHRVEPLLHSLRIGQDVEPGVLQRWGITTGLRS